jgi:hypothetical protein
MNLQDHIKAVLLLSGSVTFPFKKKIPEWYNEIKLTHLELDNHAPYIISDPYEGTIEYTDLNIAVSDFVNKSINKKNISLAFKGIRKHNLSEQDFEDMSDSTMRRLVRKYFAEYFDKDYPSDLTGIESNV